MNHDQNCIFCMIVRGDAPSLKVYEDEDSSTAARNRGSVIQWAL